MTSLRSALALYGLLAFACAPSLPPSSSPTRGQAPTAGTEISPGASLTPTPPDGTATAASIATPTSTAPPAAGCVAVDTTFQSAYQWAGSLQAVSSDAPVVGCATAAARSLLGAVQNFRFPVLGPGTVLQHPMLWRSDTKTIYVIQVVDRLTTISRGWAYPDAWTEASPEVPAACASLSPPAETYPPSTDFHLRTPIRGFGKVWCDHMLWNTVGWATEDEAGVSITIQPAQKGIMIRAGARVILLDNTGRAITGAYG